MKRSLYGIACGLLLASWSSAECLAPAHRQALFFPTFGYRSSTTNGWVVPVHGWVYEPETRPYQRRLRTALLRDVLGIPEREKKNKYFVERGELFLAHSLENQSLDLTLDAERFHLQASDEGGHVIDQVMLPGTVSAGWQTFATDISCGAGAAVLAAANLIEPQGRLIVSDIDDTIKVSDVGHRAALFSNTFLKPFKAVPGMADVFHRWSVQDPTAAFCYMSASPWQLYPALDHFLRDSGFPSGVLDLKRFRLKDRSVFALFTSPTSYKTPLLEALAQQFPERTFILVGDNGQQDPEIYGAFARKYPAKVGHIYIRQINALESPQRFAHAFEGVPVNLWLTFRDANEIHG
jgi:phosphatidate phosphatase APP1